MIESPDDDAPRLVYADALMRAGDPRGELIALQMSSAEGAAERAAELLALHRAQWIDALPNVEDAVFERGFATSVVLRGDNPADAQALDCCDLEPIRGVTLMTDHVENADDIDPTAVARWFARDPRTERLRTLDLTRVKGGCWGGKPFEILLSAPLPNLRGLRVSDGSSYGPRTISMLEGLTTLAFIAPSTFLLDDGIAILAASPRSASFESLTFEKCRLGESAGRLVGECRNFANLRSLVLDSNRLDDDGAIALARSTILASLTRLSLNYNGVGDDFLAALATSSALPRLTRLAVNGSRKLTSQGIAALAASPRFATLEHLWVGGCDVDDAGVIARTPSALRRINLYNNPFTVDGARALANSPLATQLEYLEVSPLPELEAVLRPAFGARLNVGS